MDDLSYRDLIAALALLAIGLYGDALIDWIDPGRIDARIAYEQSQQAHTERAVCEAFGMCAGRP